MQCLSSPSHAPWERLSLPEVRSVVQGRGSRKQCSVRCGHPRVCVRDEVQVPALPALVALWITSGKTRNLPLCGCFNRDLGPLFEHLKLDVGVCRVTHRSLLRTYLLIPECGSFCGRWWCPRNGKERVLLSVHAPSSAPGQPLSF